MTFTERLKSLGFLTYDEYLVSEHWIAFKIAYYASDRPRTCQVCGTRGVQLHHWTYERLGQESLDDVVPLCRKHHEEVHKVLKEKGWWVDRTEDAVCILRGEEPTVSKKSKKSKPKQAKRRRGGRRKGKKVKCPKKSQAVNPHSKLGRRLAFLARQRRDIEQLEKEDKQIARTGKAVRSHLLARDTRGPSPDYLLSFPGRES
jgi:hypothetical protein